MQIIYTHQKAHLYSILYYHIVILPADRKYNDKGNQKKNDWNDDSHEEGSVVRVRRNLSRPFGFTKYFPSCVCSNFEPVSHKIHAAFIFDNRILFVIALKDKFI